MIGHSLLIRQADSAPHPDHTLKIILPVTIGASRRNPHFYTRTLLTALCFSLLIMLPLDPVPAQERELQFPEGQELSEEDRQALKDQIRQELRKHRKESAASWGNQHSVMVTANCIEGYVQDAEVKKSAPDVEIISEQGVVCNAGGCRGWQVEARRENDVLFDIEIILQCSQ
jgi:hypothetical protein